MGLSELVKQVAGRMGKTKQVEVFVFVVLGLGSFLVVFGSSRRRHNNAFLRCLILVAQVSIFTLITFISGQMVSILSEDEGLFFPIWAAYLALFYGIPDAISAHDLADNEQWRKFRFKFAIEVFLVIVVFGLELKYTKYSPLILASVVFLILICLWKASERIHSLEFGSSAGLARATHVHAAYMSQLQRAGYKEYLVAGPDHGDFMKLTDGGDLDLDIKRKELITVQKVWSCEDGILSVFRDKNSEMKDVCLSYSLFHLLCCHFAGFTSSCDGQSEFLRDVVGDKNHERPFRVVELELGFLYDHFYTKYSVIARNPWRKLGQFGALAAVSLAIKLLFLAPLEDPSLYAGKDDQKIQNAKDAVFHYILVTRIIIGVALCLETLQIFLFAVSNWWSLILLCKYVAKQSWRNNSLFERFVRFVCKLPRLKQWRRELGQYSFLESFSKHPFLWIGSFVTSFFLENPRKGYVGKTSVPLSADVQKAVLAWMVRKGAQLSNGRKSLIENHVRNPELLSACKLDKVSKVIMTWHIATSICEHKHSKDSSSSSWFVVSMALSKYCAYLVAFGSRLLPDHSYGTDYLFRHMVAKTGKVLKDCKSMKEKIDEIEKIVLHEKDREMKDRSVVGAGGRVAKLLKEKVGDDDERLWKILGDFWTEMVLFVAPADDPWAHAECLAQGGEFVTHLMALLFHSGIAKRECIQDRVMV